MPTIQKLLGKHRSEIKGFAILWVVFFHAQLGLAGGLYQLQRIGYGGVDLFFFMSGFGLYHSLEKDRDLKRYLKRRAIRILPAYLPFCLVWLAVILPLYGGGLAESVRIAVGNLSMLGYFASVPQMINWYVSALAVSLLIAPVLHALLSDCKSFGKMLCGLLIFSYMVGLCFVDNILYTAVSRLPVFLLGMAAASPKTERIGGKKAAVCLTAGCLAALAVLYICMERYEELLIPYALYWHPFVLIAPALCAGIGWLASKIPAKLLAPLRFLGEASFEIFLFNVWVELLGKRYGLCSTPVEWALWSGASILAGCLYHVLIRRMNCQKSKL